MHKKLFLTIITFLCPLHLLAMQPCPKGTSPWHFSSISLYSAYLIIMLFGMWFITVKSVKAKKFKWAWVLLTIILVLLFSYLAIGLLFYISWSWPCG